jgi:hypothetical protein
VFWEHQKQLQTIEVVSELGTSKKVKIASNERYYFPKSICIISSWNFASTFERILAKFHDMSIEYLELPIERYIRNLFQVPLPPKGKIFVEYAVLDQPFVFKRSPPNQNPYQNDVRCFCLFALFFVDRPIS